ncbi:MAG: fibronectin type III domain-containing protein [Bacteroidia bacterium]|nr:fibronectin type III domain-containing protein [Bacteroidia bacterium]
MFSAQNSLWGLTKPAYEIKVTAKTCNSISIKWKRGDGQLCLVTCSKVWQPIGIPNNGGSFSPNSYYGLGNDVGNENYVVFSGIDSTITVRNLQEDSLYTFRVFEFDYNPFVYLTQSIPSHTDSTSHLVAQQSNTVLNACKNRNKVLFNVTANADFAISGYQWIFQDSIIQSMGNITRRLPAAGNNVLTMRILPDMGCKMQQFRDTVYITPGAENAVFTAPTPACTHTPNFFEVNITFGKVSQTSFTRKWVFDDGKEMTTSVGIQENKDTLPHSSKLIVYSLKNNVFSGCSDTFGFNYKLLPAPVFSLGSDTCVSKGNVLPVKSPIVASSYLWNGKLGNATQFVLDSGKLILQVIADNGCSYADSIKVQYCKPNGISSVLNPQMLFALDLGNQCMGLYNNGKNTVPMAIYTTNGKMLWTGQLPTGETILSNIPTGVFIAKPISSAAFKVVMNP